MKIKRSMHMDKGYRLLLGSYIVVMAVALCISILGYAYSYWTIRNDIKLNYSAMLKIEKLAYDKEWNRIVENTSEIASNSKVIKLAQLNTWHVEELFDVVDLVTELSTSMGNNKNIESLGAYFYGNESFVTNRTRYAKQINYLYLQDYGMTVDQFTSAMKGVSGYYVFTHGKERYMVFYENVFNSSYKKVIASSFVIIPWKSLNMSGNSMLISKDSGSFLVNTDGELIGNSNEQVNIKEKWDSYLSKDHQVFYKKFNNKEYILSSVSSDVLNIHYFIYAPKTVFFKNTKFLGYIIFIELLICILAGGKLAIYFSKKNYMPVERLLSMLKIQKEEMKDSSFNQIYQSLENSLQKLITGQENLYHRINNIDSVVEKYVITNLMRGWNQDDGWAEEYLLKIREKYPIVNYRIILFSFNHVEQSLFANEQKDANRPINNPLMVFSIENVINEMVLKYEYNNNSSKSKLKGLIIEMGDMTACIVNVSDESMEQELKNSVQHAIDFFRSAFKMDSFATISGIHSDYEELSTAYEEALMALTHKSFWGSHLTDIVLFDNEKAAYSDNFVGNKLILQAKKLSNCLLMKDYSKASDILDETLEKCFSRDINRLAYNQYQASALVCIIFSNLSENVTLAGNVMSGTDWTSSDRILSMKSLEDIRVNLHSILDEFAAKYEETSDKSEEPEWLQKVEEYTREHYVDSDINISLVADKFHISLSHLGRTFKKYRGVNMLDYIHELRIKRAKELMNQGISVTDCAAEIGYVDAKSFIRAFKRCEGITPGQYKSGHME